MPEVVDDARAPAQLLPIGGRKPTQRKPCQLPGKHHQKQHAQHKTRNGIPHQHEQRGDQIKARACPHRLGNAQRHGHQIADQKGPQAQADGDRQLFLDELPDALVLKEAAAQVKPGKLAHHLHKALSRWLVKAIERLDLVEALLVNALAATVAHAAALRTTAGPRLGLGQVLLHRATGYELDHGKGQQQHAQQGRDHQQQAFEDVGEHACGAPASGVCVAHGIGIRRKYY
ncbi:hypothetical protein D3C72_1322360 [compost metagenome]